MKPLSSRYYLWEASVRVFHWLLVLSIIGMFVTIKTDHTEWHGRLGIIVIGLLTFRCVLGIFGGELIQFHRFISSPANIIAYLQGKWRGFGHNPIGAWSALGLIGLTFFQAVSGLFANDDIAFDGPWVVAISRSLSDQLTHWHEITSKLLLLLIGIHIAAIIFYALVKKERLVPPMVLGWKDVRDADEPIPDKPFRVSHPLVIALAILFAIAACVFAAKGGLWLTQ